MSEALRLGRSQGILPYSHSQIISADKQLNKFVINTAEYALKGLAVGLVASLFFLKRKRVALYGMGFGAGVSVFTQFA